MESVKHLRKMPKLSVLISLLVVVVVLLSYALVTLMSGRAMRAQEERSIASAHDKVSKYLNDGLTNMGNVSLLSLSRDIPIGSIGDMETNVDLYSTLYRDVQGLTRAYPDISSIYFYSGIDRKVFHYSTTSHGIVDFDEFHDLQSYYAHLAAGAYTLLTPTRQVSPHYLDRGDSSARETLSILSLFIKFPFRNRSEDVLAVNIKSAYFHEFLSTSNLPVNSTFLLVDSDGQILLTHPTGPGYLLSQDDYRKLVDAMPGREMAYFSLSNGEYTVFASPQKQDRLFYLAVPSSGFVSAYDKINRTVLIIEIIILLIGVFLAVMLAGSVSKPLSDILARMRGQREPTSDPVIRYSLFQEIRQEVDGIIVRSRQQEEMLSRYFVHYKENTVRALLLGEARQDHLPHDLGKLFDGSKAYQVVLCVWDGSVSRAEADAFLQKATGLLELHAQVASTPFADDRHAFLLGLPDTEAAQSQAMFDALAALQEEGGRRVAVSVGPPVERVAEVSTSFFAAAGAFHAEGRGSEGLIFSSDNPASTRMIRTFLQNLHEEIAGALHAGDSGRLTASVDALFLAMKQANFSLSRQRRCCLYLLYEISLLPRWEEPLQGEERLFEEIRNIQDAVALQSKMRAIMKSLLNGMPKAEEKKRAGMDDNNVGLIEQVQLYVREHYHEDISLNQIADYVFFSPQYLGKLFRDITGGTFTSYLVSVRMEAAAQMLTGTHKSVAVIAGAVGYASVQSFDRVFKGYYACTPGEYRRVHGTSRLEKKDE